MKKAKIWTIIGASTAMSGLIVAAALLVPHSCSGSHSNGEHSIKITQKEGGTISVVGGITKAKEGTEITFIITPNSDYYNAILYINSGTNYIYGLTEYTITMPNYNLNVWGLFLNNSMTGVEVWCGFPEGDNAPSNYFVDPENPGNKLSYRDVQCTRGSTVEMAGLPIPICGVEGKVFDCWHIWDPSKENEVGAKVEFSKTLTDDEYIFVATYKNATTGNLFSIDERHWTSTSSKTQQRFTIPIYFDGDEAVTLQTEARDPKNFLRCQNIVHTKGTSDFGLFEDGHQIKRFEPHTEIDVQFSLWFPPQSDFDATYEMAFQFVKPDGSIYEQVIENLRVIKN